MSDSIREEIRNHLQVNDALQAPVQWAEIAARSKALVVRRRSIRRGLWIGVATAVAVLFLFGVVPLLIGGGGAPRPVATSVPIVPSTVPVAPTVPATIDSTTALPNDGAGVESRSSVDHYIAALSEVISTRGPFTWRTFELPRPTAEPREIIVGLDDRFYLITADEVWKSEDGTEWFGYHTDTVGLRAYRMGGAGNVVEVGNNRLLVAGGGGGIGGPDGQIIGQPVSLGVYDLPEPETGQTAVSRVSDVDLEGTAGGGAVSGAVDADGRAWLITDLGRRRRMWRSADGITWSRATNAPGSINRVVAVGGGIYAVNQAAEVYFTTDGSDWAMIHDGPPMTGVLGRWGDAVLMDDGQTIWKLTNAGAESLGIGANRALGGEGWIWQVAGSDLGIIDVRLDADRYLYSPDGVDWETVPYPDGWEVRNVFIERPLAMNNRAVLLVAQPTGSHSASENTVLIGTRK
ncbi:MAG: hypothetical protein WB239_08525 [Acidimicrobiia bacterium]